MLRSFTFAQGNQRCMVIVNSDVSSAHQVNFAGSNAPTNNVTTYQFAPPALNSANEMGALTDTSTLTAPMSNTTTPGVDVTSGYTLPAHSVTAFLWQTNGDGSTPTAAMPTFSPAAGTYNSAQTVTISSPTAGTTIYYTTNGSTPTTSFTKYSGPVTVSSNQTLQAIAVGSGYSNSPVATAAYVIATVLPAPVFSVAAGSYTSAQTVTISDATSGATYYTTNGTTPTTSSTKYSGPVTVSASETLKAIAVETGYTNSAVASASYVISSASSGVFNITNIASSAAQLNMNRNAKLDGAKLQLTNGSLYEDSSTWYSQPVNVKSFTTNFTFQETNAVGEWIYVCHPERSDRSSTVGSGTGINGIGGGRSLQFSGTLRF